MNLLTSQWLHANISELDTLEHAESVGQSLIDCGALLNINGARVFTASESSLYQVTVHL